MQNFIKGISYNAKGILCKVGVATCLLYKAYILRIKANINLKAGIIFLIFTLIFVVLGFAHANSIFFGESANNKDLIHSKVKNSDTLIKGESNTEEKIREVKVVIDPGHGGEDVGTYYGKLYEKNINLEISLRFGKLLEQEGIQVVYTRDKDIEVDLKERARIANDLNAALFISVHNNKMPDAPDYKGTETLYCTPEKQDDHKMDGERLASIVQKELVKTLKTYNIGIINRPNLAVLHRTKMPAVIAEIAYISNWSDREKLSTKAFREKAAEALSRATVTALQEMGAIKDREGKWSYISK